MRLVVLLALILASLPLTAQERKRVAVLDFEYATVRSNAAAIFGTDLDIGRGIRDLMVEKFVESGHYSVIERAALDAVLAEQNFGNSDRANPASAAALGKILGVDAIIIGSITQFGRDDQERKVGAGAFGGFGRKYGLGGVKQSNAKAIVAVTARMIDTDTAEILGVASGEGESTRSGTGLYGGGAASGAGGVGGIDMTSSNFGSTLIGEAVNEAIAPLVTGLESYSDRVRKNSKPVEALVADYSDGFVILNVGTNGGVGIGDHFEIKQVVREVKDPATGRVIRRIEDTAGTAIITEVDELSAVGRFSGDGTPQVGDTASRTQ